MKTREFPASQCGIKDMGWLKSNFTFSFGSHQDPTNTSFGTLQVFNDDYVKPGEGFGIHPHYNIEIISVVLQGKVNHKDTLGYITETEADGVQVMSAGSGIRHEEYSLGSEETNFLQIWISPKQQNINPRYQRRVFPKQNRKNKLTTIVSYEEGQAHCWINQNAKLSLGYYEAGSITEYSFKPENMCLFVFVISGNISINNNNIAERDALGIWDTNRIQITCNEESEFLIIETPIN